MAENWKGRDENEKEQSRQERRERWLDRRELKRILLGHTHQNEEGKLTADKGPFAINRFGVEDGAIQVYFLGITFRRKRYRTSMRHDKFMEAADKACANLGRRVILEQLPGSVCVFRRFRLSVPALLYVYIEDDEVNVVTVSGRSFSGPRSMRALRKGFESEMGDRITAIKKETGKNGDKEKK